MAKRPFTRRKFLSTAGTIAGAGAGACGPAVAPRSGDAPLVKRRGTPVVPVELEVNGRAHRFDVDARTTLLDFLRERLDLTGAKKGCDRGECGACTVHLDGERVNACMVLAASCDGRAVLTVEGLGREGALHPVQRAFVDQDGLQCGFCTPGQVMSAVACIREGHATSDADVREWMSGNLCRCAAYPQIVAAVRLAAGRKA